MGPNISFGEKRLHMNQFLLDSEMKHLNNIGLLAKSQYQTFLMHMCVYIYIYMHIYTHTTMDLKHWEQMVRSSSSNTSYVMWTPKSIKIQGVFQFEEHFFLNGNTLFCLSHSASPWASSDMSNVVRWRKRLLKVRNGAAANWETKGN